MRNSTCSIKALIMFLVLYIDPETNAICSSYLDFISTLNDGTIQIIEVKGDNKIDDTVVQAKAAAALEMASASKMGCLMLESTRIMKKKFYNFVVHTKILLHAEEKSAFDLKIKNAFFRPKMRCAVTISS